jgi:hypothetical protein
MLIRPRSDPRNRQSLGAAADLVEAAEHHRYIRGWFWGDKMSDHDVATRHARITPQALAMRNRHWERHYPEMIAVADPSSGRDR